MRELLGDFLRLFSFLHQDVARFDLVFRLELRDLLVIIFLGIVLGDRLLHVILEIGIAQSLTAPIIEPCLITRGLDQSFTLSSVRQQLILNEKFNKHTTLGGRRQLPKFLPDLGLGIFEVIFCDRLAIDACDHRVLSMRTACRNHQQRTNCDRDSQGGRKRPGKPAGAARRT